MTLEVGRKCCIEADRSPSHAHWDHTGDMSTFPGHTDLVVGRGFKDHFLRGVGNSALGGILPSDVK